MKRIFSLFLILHSIFFLAAGQNEKTPAQPISMAEIDKKFISLDIGYTLINKRTGEELFPPQKSWVIYDNMSEVISGRLIRVQSNSGSMFGYIDMYGKIVVPMKYRMLTRFYNGVAVAQMGPGNGTASSKYGVINSKGEVVVPFEYEFINAYNSTEFNSPYVSARMAKNRSGLLDITTGKHLIPFHFGFVFSFSPDGFALVADTLGKKMICNSVGKPLYINQNPRVIDINYRSSKGKLLIEHEDKRGYTYLDTAGQPLPQEGEDFEFNKKLIESKSALVEKLEVAGDVYYHMVLNGQRTLTDASFKPIVQANANGTIMRTNLVQEIPGAMEVQFIESGKAPVLHLIAKHKVLLPNKFSRFHYPFIESFPGLIYGEESGKFQIFTHEGRAFALGQFHRIEPVNHEGRWQLAAFNDTLPQLYTAEGKLVVDKNLARGVQLSLMDKLQQEKWYSNKINNLTNAFSFPVEIKTEKKKQVLVVNGKPVFSAEASSAYRKTDSIFVFVNDAENRFYKLGDQGFFMEGYMNFVGDGKFGLTQSLEPGAKFALFNGWVKRLTEYEFQGFTTAGSNTLAAKKETGWALLNANYQPITPFIYDKFYAFYNGFGAAECNTPKSIHFLKKEGVVIGSLANALSNQKIQVEGGMYLVGCGTPDSTLEINRYTGVVKKAKKLPITSGTSSSGGGKKSCYTCSGSGKVLAWVGNECGKCGGSGGDAYKCIDCNGKGQVAETKVLSAQYYGSMNYAQVMTQTKPKECRSCKGRGLKGLCYACDGKGVQNARKEEVDCGRCKGTGEVY